MSAKKGRPGFFESGPKRPPPEGGIRMKKAGTTWWGQRWIGALEQILRGDAGRLSRGRTYARAGRTHELVIEHGNVSAKVTGSRAEPYQVRITLRALTADAWQQAIVGLAEKAQFSAELLTGHMPASIDEVFVAAGVSLFPRQRSELETHCSCPDWGDPCKHVAATHYVLGEALDRDPFLLFELRGRSKEQVLEALRAARGAEGAEEHVADAEAVVLGPLRVEDYDKPRAPLPALQFHFDEPKSHGAVLRQLGTPTGWEGELSPADALAPLVRAAAEHARSLALGEEDERPEPEPPGRKRVPARGSAEATPRDGKNVVTKDRGSQSQVRSKAK